MQKPNLKKIIADNLDKAKFQTKSNPGLPTDGWINKYRKGGTYKPTQLNHYDEGGFIVTDTTTVSPSQAKPDPSEETGSGISSYPLTLDDETSWKEGLNEGKQWLKDWYAKRVTLPQFKKIANQRLNALNKNFIGFADMDQKEYPGATAFYAPANGNVHFQMGDPYSYSAATILHEYLHGLDDLIPQDYQDLLTKKNLIPEKKWLKTYTGKNSLNNPDFKYPYYSDRTEVRARLNTFRRRYKIDPTKKYTKQEMQDIINHYRKNISPDPNNVAKGFGYEQRSATSDNDIDQLLDIIGDDPSKLAELNNTVVKNSNNKTKSNFAKMGGQIFKEGDWVDKYKMGGGMFPEYDSYAPPRMNNGGLLSRTVTCSNCGWSWKAVDGGKDVMTCHKCGGNIKMKEGGLTEYGPGGLTTDGCRPNFYKNAQGKCVPESKEAKNQVALISNWVNSSKTSTPYTPVSQQQINNDKAQAVLNKFKQGKVSVVDNNAVNQQRQQEYKKIEQDRETRDAAYRERMRLEKEERIKERLNAKAFNERKTNTFTFPTGETKTWDQMDWREKSYIAGKSLEGKGRFNENDETFFDDFLNPFNMITSMGGGLGTAPYIAKQTDSYLPYFGAVAAPLIAGALGGFGPKNGGYSKITTGLNSVKNAGLKWSKELVNGSLAAGRPKLPSFVTALRTEAAGFNPSTVTPHPSLNSVQKGYTGSWIQAASKENPGAFDEMLAYLSGPERKQAGDMQLLSEVLPWSKTQKLAGQNLPYNAKIMSFGAGKYGNLENAFKQGAIGAREYVLLKNYNTQGARIAASPTLSEAMNQTISRLRAHPELYNPNEMLSSTLANNLRSAPLLVGSAETIAGGIQSLKNKALQNNFITSEIVGGSKKVATGLAEETAKHQTADIAKEKIIGHRYGGSTKQMKNWTTNWTTKYK